MMNSFFHPYRMTSKKSRVKHALSVAVPALGGTVDVYLYSQCMFQNQSVLRTLVFMVCQQVDRALPQAICRSELWYVANLRQRKTGMITSLPRRSNGQCSGRRRKYDMKRHGVVIFQIKNPGSALWFHSDLVNGYLCSDSLPEE